MSVAREVRALEGRATAARLHYEHEMPFRDAAPRGIRGSIPYGPFPVHGGGVSISLVFLVVALAALVGALDEDRVVCTPGASCVVSHRLMEDPQPFPSSALRGADVTIERGSKGARYGVVTLVLASNTRIRLARTDPSSAEDIAARIRSAVDAQAPVDERIRGPWWAGIAAAVFVALGIASARSSLRGLGRIRLELLRDGAALGVRRRVLGVPVSSYEVSLDQVTDVRVEEGGISYPLASRHAPPAPAGRIVLGDRSGIVRPVTDRMLPGLTTHLRAASALRAALEMEPQPGGVEQKLAALTPVVTSLGHRLAYSWIGVTVGGLLGLAAYGITGLALGLLRGRDGPGVGAFAVGFGGGAALGVALVMYLTRPRLPR